VWFDRLERCMELSESPTLLVEEVVEPTFAATVDGVWHGPPLTKQPDLSEEKELAPSRCLRFLRGICKNVKCKFSHEEFCKDFLRDKCSRKACKYSHVNDEGIDMSSRK